MTKISTLLFAIRNFIWLLIGATVKLSLLIAFSTLLPYALIVYVTTRLGINRWLLLAPYFLLLAMYVVYVVGDVLQLPKPFSRNSRLMRILGPGFIFITGTIIFTVKMLMLAVVFIGPYLLLSRLASSLGINKWFLVFPCYLLLAIYFTYVIKTQRKIVYGENPKRQTRNRC